VAVLTRPSADARSMDLSKLAVSVLPCRVELDHLRAFGSARL